MRLLKSKYFLAIVFIASILLSFTLFGNTINGEFVIDDTFYISRPELKDPRYLTKIWLESFLPNHPGAGLFRPFSVFTFALNKIIFGTTPQSYHVVNILLNGAVVFLLFLLVQKLFKSRLLATFTALFYSFLPIHSEAVAYIKARDEILGTGFVLLSWLAFIRAVHKEQLRKHWLLLSTFLFFLGLLTKEFVILSPAVFILTYWALVKPKKADLIKRVLIAGLFFGTAFGIYYLMRYIALDGFPYGTDDIAFVANPLLYVPWLTGFWTAFKIAFIYISKIFVPYNLSATYHYSTISLVANPLTSPSAILGGIFLLILAILSIHKTTRSLPVGIGAATFLILYFPSSQFLFRGGDIVGERWMYLASLGIAFIAGWGMAKLYQFNKYLGIGLAIIVFVAYTAVLIPRNHLWTSRRLLYKSMTETAPNSVKGHVNLGFDYAVKGELANAKKELARARAIHETYPGVYDLGTVIAYEEKNFPEVQRLIEASLAANPIHTLSAADYNYMYLARAYFIQGYYEQALAALKILFEMNADNPLAQDKILYVVCLTKLGRYQESIEAVQKYLKNDMFYKEVKIVMAVNHWRLGEREEAKKYFDFVEGRTEQEKIELINKF
jgi:hypothetical protein